LECFVFDDSVVYLRKWKWHINEERKIVITPLITHWSKGSRIY
jgi:hypothetical protein